MAVEITDILVLQKGRDGELRKTTVEDLLNTNGGGSNYLPLIGGDLTGDLTFNTDKIVLDATTGNVTANAFIGDGSQLTNLPDLSDVYLPLVGGTLTGDLTAPKFIGDGSLLTNLPGGGGGASVSVEDTPPADAEEGDLWWNTTDNTLYIYYIDATSEQWVAATPTESGSIDADDFVAVDGDNMTGDLTLGTDKITLDATGGSITAAGGRFSASNDGVVDIQAVDNSADASILFRAGSANASAGANAFVVTANGSINAAGTASFEGGTVKLGNVPGITGPGGVTCVNVIADTPVGANPVFVGKGNGSETIRMNGDGSITAAGSITIVNGKSIGVRTDSVNAYLDSNANIVFRGGSGAVTPIMSVKNDGDVLIGGSNLIGGSSNTTLKADGSATFNGTITAGGYSLSQLPQL